MVLSLVSLGVASAAGERLSRRWGGGAVRRASPSVEGAQVEEAETEMEEVVVEVVEEEEVVVVEAEAEARGVASIRALVPAPLLRRRRNALSSAT